MPKTKRKYITNEWGEKELKWVQVTKTGRKVPGQNKLKGQTAWGWSHADYKEWGKQGGRPLKWNSEAERKRAYRLKKKAGQTKIPKSSISLFESFSTSDYSHSNSRPGAWTYHSDRPSTSTERVRKFRGKII